MREAENVGPSQNQMIDEPYVNQCQRILDANGDELVGLARLLDARWMIVIHDARGRSFLQSELHDFTWVYRCTVDRSAEQIEALYDPVPSVEQDQAKHLIVETAQARGQVFTRLLRRLQRRAATYPMGEHLSGSDEDCFTLCRYHRTVGVESKQIMVRHLRSPDLSRAGLPDPEAGHRSAAVRAARSALASTGASARRP